MSRSDLLEGKTAVVTGATRGLGRAIATALAQAGARVVVSSRKVDSCREVANQIAAETGADVVALPLHVGDWDAIEPFVDDVLQICGRVDVLVNNAGIAPQAPSLLEVSQALFDKTVEVNLRGPFRLMAVTGARMLESGGGSIINISSVGAVRPGAGEAPYSSTKSGLNALTMAFAQEYAPAVRVNCVMPGAFATDMSETWDEAFLENVLSGLPAGRLGDPAEIGGLIVHLASDEARYTTGAIIPVDGGRSAVY